MTFDAVRRGTIWQVVLLLAGLTILIGISASSVFLVNQARKDNQLVTHTVEIEKQISDVLLEIRRAESSVRGYLLTGTAQFYSDYENAAASVLPAIDKVGGLTEDSASQQQRYRDLRAAAVARLDQFKTVIEAARNTPAGETITKRDVPPPAQVNSIRDIALQMSVEEGRLLVQRGDTADRTQRLASLVTSVGSGLVIALAGLSIFLIRRSSRARDEAEAQLRDNNLNLEAAVTERTTDLREANDEIQRFAYIVSHDLRSPLVNIMGFTGELEEMRTDIFRRISTLASDEPLVPDTNGEFPEPALSEQDKLMSKDFTEALGFIKSSIAKMDRLISAILHLTREGRREFKPVRIDTKALVENISSTVAHQAIEAEAHIRVESMPEIESDPLAIEQIFSNLIDNALKYLKPGVPGDILVRGRTKMGFGIFEFIDNGRGIDAKDHQRIFDLFRRAGTQDKPGQGIGLAHARTLVRRLGGTMSVASELHNGCTFTITLPVRWTGNNRDLQS